ncbi:hypothetical protein MMC07_008681 [Pseudocyphellaria aurata]|nr:hypothetical protein [Pseudocyphellaria aurata]
MCQFVPHDWIFSDGECCASGTEPFELAEWVEKMCDETWRTPFQFYGGMAKEDWEEWVQPWNWTVRPLNSTNEPTLQPRCSSASSYLGQFAIENILSLLEVFVLAYLKHIQRKNDDKESWQAKLWRKLPLFKRVSLDMIQWSLVGILHAFSLIGSNIWTASIVHGTSGYQHVSVVRLTVLFCARPRMPWMACVLILISHEIFVNAALSVAVTELILQVAGSCYLFLTTNTGRARGFYHVKHLKPFWRGSNAHIMYSGTIFWTVFVVFFLPALLIFLASGEKVLQILIIIKEAGRKASQQAEQAAIDRLPPWMRNWSHKQIIRFSKSLPKIPALPVPPRLRQWEQQQRSRIVTAAVEINQWFYTSQWQRASDQPYSQVKQLDGMNLKPVGRAQLPQASGQPYLPLQQDDWINWQPMNRNTTPTQIMLVNQPGMQRKRDRTKVALTVVFFTGMCTFAAQWMFWDGFVKSSGDR